MSNWFEDNPAKSIIGYTILIAGVTWATSTFIIDDNKVNLYKAQVGDRQAVAEQYKAKIDVLESELIKLREQNSRYLKWLQSQPASFPMLESRIMKLEEENATAKKILAHPQGEHHLENMTTGVFKNTGSQKALPYNYFKDMEKGDAFVDPYTGATLGVSSIDSNNTAKIVLVLPGEKKQSIDDAKPGDSWDFSQFGLKFSIILTKISWLGDRIEVTVMEKPK